MVELAANLSTLFCEHAYADRFAAAAAAGFGAVELQFCDRYDADETARCLRRSGLELVLVNAPAGDVARGETGLATGADSVARFQDGIRVALEFARATDCRRVHVLAGPRPTTPEGRSRLVENLRWAATRFAPFGIDLMLEALNDRDRPGYAIATLEEADALLREIAATNVALQFDLYHAQLSGGNIVHRWRRLGARVGHVQIAGVPDRHEPDEGELAVPWLLEFLRTEGYRGHVGCEYTPRGGTIEGLGWAAPWLKANGARASGSRPRRPAPGSERP